MPTKSTNAGSTHRGGLPDVDYSGTARNVRLRPDDLAGQVWRLRCAFFRMLMKLNVKYTVDIQHIIVERYDGAKFRVDLQSGMVETLD